MAISSGGDTETIGDQIRHRRLVQKLLQRELAAQLGVTPSTIFNWESNRSKPEARLMASVEDFLGSPPRVSPPSTGHGFRDRASAILSNDQ